jgi:UDP-glucose 4-epimerase
MGTNVIVITGSGDYWGHRLAERLATEAHVSLIGLDTGGTGQVAQSLDSVRADVRDPALAEFLESENVDTVCHLKFDECASHSPAVDDLNLGGAQNILNACALAGVRQVIFKSSLDVYGAHPDNDIALRETHSLRASRRYGYTKQRLDIEALISRIPQITEELRVTNLRFANIVGPTADTPMTRFLKLSPAPILMGFDPMQQIIHEDDVVEALAHAVLSGSGGTYNIAADSPLPLSRILALTQTMPIPIPLLLLTWWTLLQRRQGEEQRRFFPIEPAYLRYSLVGDIEAMRRDFGYQAQYTAEEILTAFAVGRRSGHQGDPPPLRDADETLLRLAMERRRRSREQMSSPAEKGEEHE